MSLNFGGFGNRSVKPADEVELLDGRVRNLGGNERGSGSLFGPLLPLFPAAALVALAQDTGPRGVSSEGLMVELDLHLFFGGHTAGQRVGGGPSGDGGVAKGLSSSTVTILTGLSGFVLDEFLVLGFEFGHHFFETLLRGGVGGAAHPGNPFSRFGDSEGRLRGLLLGEAFEESKGYGGLEQSPDQVLF